MTDGLKQIDGQVASIDYENRHFALEDRAGIIFLKVSWAPKFDRIMGKQKVGFYEKPTVCMISDTSASLEDIQYTQRPADWPKSGGKGKAFQPRNERLIVIQSMCKLGAEVFAITTTPNQMDFDVAMDLIIDRAIHDTDTIMKAGEQK